MLENHGNGSPENAQNRLVEISVQTANYLVAMKDLTGRNDEEVSSLANLVGRYMNTRYDRAVEVNSGDVQKARVLWAQYFEESFYTEGTTENIDQELAQYLLTCMDGRVKRMNQTAIPAKGGGSTGGGVLQFPGGVPSGVHQDGFGGELVLDRNSTFAREFFAGIKGRRNVFEIFDSHIHCAAAGIRDSHHQISGDGGLLRDVEYKVQLAQLLRREVELKNEESQRDAKQRNNELPAHKTNMHVLHVSFDPNNGFWTLGLDLEQNRLSAVKTGYTAEKLDDLNASGKIVRMENLAHNELAEIFSSVQFEARPDWKQNYGPASLQFIQNLFQIREQALPIVKERLITLYAGKVEIDEITLNLYASAALANAYNGWLNNRSEYPYKEHTESVIAAVVGGEYGPFQEVDALEIFRDDPELAANAVLASQIIRKNISDGRVKGDVNAPIPMIVQGRITSELSQEDRIVLKDAVSHLNSYLPELNWEELDYRWIREYLDLNFPALPGDASRAIERIFSALKVLYDKTSQNFQVFSSGSIIAIPTLIGPDREPIAVLNFVPKNKQKVEQENH